LFLSCGFYLSPLLYHFFARLSIVGRLFVGRNFFQKVPPHTPLQKLSQHFIFFLGKLLKKFSQTLSKLSQHFLLRESFYFFVSDVRYCRQFSGATTLKTLARKQHSLGYFCRDRRPRRSVANTWYCRKVGTTIGRPLESVDQSKCNYQNNENNPSDTASRANLLANFLPLTQGRLSKIIRLGNTVVLAQRTFLGSLV